MTFSRGWSHFLTDSPQGHLSGEDRPKDLAADRKPACRKDAKAARYLAEASGGLVHGTAVPEAKTAEPRERVVSNYGLRRGRQGIAPCDLSPRWTSMRASQNFNTHFNTEPVLVPFLAYFGHFGPRVENAAISLKIKVLGLSRHQPSMIRPAN
jgi:hypothetical protein